MKITSISANDLSEQHVAAWLALQRANPAIDNPSFHPEFTKVVAAVRDDVEVAVMSEDARYVGFLPFHRDARNIGRPVGSILSDFHGVVASEDARWEAMKLLQDCGLLAWHFDHLVATQKPFSEYHLALDDSPYMDLRDGYEAYIEQRRGAGTMVSQAERKLRKLQREVGPIRFEMHDGNDEILDVLVRWKQKQLRAMNFVDIFKFDWVEPVLREVARRQTDSFCGLLSVLYAGDKPTAIHLGYQSGSVVSSWIPAYSPTFAKYSPGLLLHLELARAAADIGVKRIDLCRGRNQMKDSLASGASSVAIGCVDARPVHRTLRRGWFRIRDFVYASALKGAPLRFYHRMKNSLST